MQLLKNDAIYLGQSVGENAAAQYLPLKWGNRHGLIAGATGTGKTVTLQVLAEGFANAGVPVFMADVKGDLSGLCCPSALQDFITDRAEKVGFKEEFKPSAYTTVFWDLYGQQGYPVRTTISEIGPLLLSRMLDLNDTQEGVLNVVFRFADEQGLFILDLKDLRALLTEVNENRETISAAYGNVTMQSIASIQRALLSLEEQGADQFFGEPALELNDFIKTDIDGRGHINILAADKLMLSPRLYATFLLWMLSELFEDLPEAGDLSKPKLVFFFDEAHLLFNDAPKALQEKIEQVVRLIRSKGVGIYFITQSPEDVPEAILAQLGNRFQHALRAFTPQQQKAIKQASQTYRTNPEFDVENVIKEMGVGEALVSTLEGSGQPSVVQRTLIRPPSSKVGVAELYTKMMIINCGQFKQKYSQTIDNISAYEVLQARMKKLPEMENKIDKDDRKKTSGRTASGIGDAAVKSLVRSMSSSVGRMIARELVRGLMGALKR